MKRARPNTWAGKVWRGASWGFTLIEVVIAIALIGLIGVAVLSALSTASLALIMSDQRATAESLARSQMEYVKNQEYVSNNSTWGGQVLYDIVEDIEDYPGYSIWSYNRTDGIVPSIIGVPWVTNTSQPYEPEDQDNGLQRIKLVIKNDGQILITLEDYKRNPEV